MMMPQTGGTSRFSALMTLLLLLCAASLAAGRNLRVFNGTEAGKNASAELGFVVALYRTPATAEMAKNMTPFCTGTLVSSNVVLTAAQCFYGDGAFFAESADSVSVAIEGEWERLIKLSYIQLHPGFVYAGKSDTTKDGFTVAPYDLAVVQLSEDATTTPADGAVRTSTLLTDGEELLIAGYGATDQSAVSELIETLGVGDGETLTTNAMHYATVNYLGARCPATEFEGTICAGGYSNTCKGDSGGPLLRRDPATGSYSVLGVVSYGPKCGEESAQGYLEYGYYTDVRIFYDDINAMIEQLPARA